MYRRAGGLRLRLLHLHVALQGDVGMWQLFKTHARTECQAVVPRMVL